MEHKAQRRFGPYGGSYVPELLMPPLTELAEGWEAMRTDVQFKAELDKLLTEYAGRPTPLTEVPSLAAAVGLGRCWLKREDLLHTGAHKLNNALGQVLLAKRMDKRLVIAETGAGQHGVATATACARLGLECVVFMGVTDMERQRPNVKRMQLLGARVESVAQGSGTLKEAVSEALRHWSRTFDQAAYCLGSALGPYPYPSMVRAFQAVIGIEARRQILEQAGQLPDVCVACVGGGSNAIGLFSAFLGDWSVELVGVEAGGQGESLGKNAARFTTGRPGVLHGCLTYLLQDEQGQVVPTHSISAGLDYPAVGPEHAALFETERAIYVTASDEEAVAALKLLSVTEGIIPALESSHALAYLPRLAEQLGSEGKVLVNLSGRGDKDLPQLFERGLL
jgi:tryptophan synthase beta chain